MRTFTEYCDNICSPRSNNVLLADIATTAVMKVEGFKKLNSFLLQVPSHPGYDGFLGLLTCSTNSLVYLVVNREAQSQAVLWT